MTEQKSEQTAADRDGWYEAIDEIDQRRHFAQELGGPERVARQHDQGKLTIRERIERFIDPDTFREIGALAGSGEYDDDGNLTGFLPKAFVAGLGKIDGRLVTVGGEDFTLSGGSGGGGRGGSAAGFMQPMALEYRIPLIQFCDGAGASPKNYESGGRRAPARMSLPDGNMWTPDVRLLGTVPVVSAVLGPAAGHVAARAVLSHFSVMTKETGSIFAGGPPLVKRALGQDLTKDELGGPGVHVHQSGTIDNEAEDEEDAFRQIRTFLSYMPSSVWETPPYREPTDDPNRREELLASIVPRDRNKSYNMRELISLIVDDGESFEMRRYFGPSLITQFARMNGYVVGIIANDPEVYAGAMTADAADKMTHFVDLCDAFNIPIALFVDVPGFMIGLRSEQQGVLRAGMRAVTAGVSASVPHIAIQVRKSYGMGGDSASAVGGSGAVKLRFGWPSGEWGAIPVEGGVAAAYRREIENAPDPDAHRLEIEERLREGRSPFLAAESFDVMDIIDPRDTRSLICEFIEASQAALKQHVGAKRPVRP
jgi:acetyl-CoA carboxylase carboxyltransferase component